MMSKTHCSLKRPKAIVFLLLLAFSAVHCITDNDNFIVFTEDIRGYPIPASNGYTYFVGTNISKVHLATRNVEKVMRVATSDLSYNISYDKGILNHQESVLLAHRTSNGPSCSNIAVITTSDMVLKEDNCLRLTNDNVFGPKISQIVQHPSEVNVFYAVGYHEDFINGVYTALIVEIQLHNSYLLSVNSFKRLNDDFTLAGTTKGWHSLDFDSTASNMFLTGIIEEGSEEMATIMSLSSDMNTVNWFKYFKQTAISSLSLEMDEIDAHYDSASNSMLVAIHTKTYTPSYYNIINVYKLDATTGSTLWEIQFRDYSGSNFGDIHSVVNPSYNEFVLFFTNTEYDHYHMQAINIDDGSLLENLQIEIFKHYNLCGISVFPDQTTGTDIEDVLMTAVDGYIMKINTRKANLDVIDNDSWDRPLYGLHYNNFTLPLTSPSDMEPVDYTPESDFFIDETDYEVDTRDYTHFYESIPTMSDATDMSIYFSDTSDIVTVPNASRFRLSQPHTKDNLRDAFIDVEFELYDMSDTSTPLNSNLYSFSEDDGKYYIDLHSFGKGSYYAKAIATESSSYTFYDFTLVVQCIDYCSECSSSSTCDTCDSGYTLSYDETCISDDLPVDPALVEGFAATAMAVILGVSAMQMQISPNLWVMINTLQILRTILLLKINLPNAVRLTVEGSSLFAQFEFGLTDLIVSSEPDEDESIAKIMDGDEMLASYFEEYGIETYRFIDYTASVVFDCLTIFILLTLLSTAWLMIYLKVKKKPVKPEVVKHLKSIFWLNGFIRLYMEILLDGIIYVLVNIRSEMFIDFALDMFSYFFMACFLCLVVCYTIFQISYIKKTPIAKWKDELKEILIETNLVSPGVLVYHMLFLGRRVVLAFNAIMFGSLGAYTHISIHFICQIFVVAVMCTYPMFESKFQKVSNLVMEFAILLVFFSAYMFQSSSATSIFKNFVMATIFLSQMIILIMTISKTIKDLVLKAKKKKEAKVDNSKSIDNSQLPHGVTLTRTDMLDSKLKKTEMDLFEEDKEMGMKKFKKDDVKLPPIKPKGSDVIPMKNMTEFDVMADEMKYQQQVQKADTIVKKKKKLRSLLTKLKKKKGKLAKKKTEESKSENTMDMTATQSKFDAQNFESSNKKSSEESGVGNSESQIENKESPKHSMMDKSEVDEMSTSKISIFSHNEIEGESSKKMSSEDNPITSSSNEPKSSGNENKNSSDDKSFDGGDFTLRKSD